MALSRRQKPASYREYSCNLGMCMEESSPKPTEDQARKEGMAQNWVKRAELPVAVPSQRLRWVTREAGRWHCAPGDGRAERHTQQCLVLLSRTEPPFLGRVTLPCHSLNNKFRPSVLFGENTLCFWFTCLLYNVVSLHTPQSASFHLKIINLYGAGAGKGISSSGLLITTGTYLELNKLREVEGH